MLEEYIKDIVKNEIAKYNLNKQYGKNSQSTYKVFGDYFNHLTFLTSSNNIRDLLYKVCEDKRINHCLYFYFFKDDVVICSISAHKFLHTKIGKLADELEIKSNRFIFTKKTGGIDIEKQKLKQENDKLKEEIEKSESETIKLTNLLNEKIDQSKKSEDEKIRLNKLLFNSYGDRYELKVLKQENKELKESLEKQKQRQYETNEFWSLQNHGEELEKLKKENKILQKSFDFISNNELLELQRKVISKERIATELNLMLSKEKNKNKELEDKLSKIYKTIEENYYQDGYYELLIIKNIISEILKES